MSNFDERLASATSHLAPVDWDATRAEAIRRRVHAVRRRRRRIGAALLVSIPLVALAAWGGFRARAHLPEPSREHVAQREVANRPPMLQLEDGATRITLANDASLEPIETNASSVVLRLVRGSAAFSVAHLETRVFRVEAGDAVIQVLGTEFEVERVGSGARVSVRSGRVRVFCGERYADIGPGESGVYVVDRSPERIASASPHDVPGANTQPSASTAETPRSPLTPRTSIPQHVDASIEPAWRSAATRGEYDEAWATLGRLGIDSVADDVGELFLASDVARLSGHPEQAAVLLQRLLTRHRSDPRASLAAFTLGRVLLDDLGRPREAAEAFASVASLENAGALAEDAAAREVEAWSRAGDVDRARSAASEYLSQHPDGPGARRVRRWSGGN